MNFDDVQVIPVTKIFREAKVSPVGGKPVVERLRREGVITSKPGPTKRLDLKPPEGRALFEELQRL